jgi:hypothetical protein
MSFLIARCGTFIPWRAVSLNAWTSRKAKRVRAQPHLQHSPDISKCHDLPPSPERERQTNNVPIFPARFGRISSGILCKRFISNKVVSGCRPSDSCQCPVRSTVNSRLNMINSNSQTTTQERWPSGLRRTLGKRVYFNEYRGFESHSLRQLFSYPPESNLKYKIMLNLLLFTLATSVTQIPSNYLQIRLKTIKHENYHSTSCPSSSRICGRSILGGGQIADQGKLILKSGH